MGIKGDYKDPAYEKAKQDAQDLANNKGERVYVLQHERSGGFQFVMYSVFHEPERVSLKNKVIRCLVNPNQPRAEVGHA